MNNRDIERKVKHIISYGSNWGFGLVRESIKNYKIHVRNAKREIFENQKILKGYEKLLKNMEKERKSRKDFDL